MNKLKITVRIILVIVLFIAFYFIIIFTYNTVYDYSPKTTFRINKHHTTFSFDTLKIISWNIGYGGLGEKSDFFYDGGKMVRPSKTYYDSCLNGIVQQLKKLEHDAHIFLLQEVDFYSKRSYYINQKSLFQRYLSKMLFSDSLINYQVPFVPFPILSPMGKVKAGLVTLANSVPFFHAYIFFENTYTWPKQIFFLDRGMLIHAFKVQPKKWLFIFNVHLSAFDDAHQARKKELSTISQIIEKLAFQGHYVIVGGDWNINPPHFHLSGLKNNNPLFRTEPNTVSFKSFQYYYDTLFPTNRYVNSPYIVGKTPVSTLDYFLVSSNIKVLEIKVIPLHFKYSDHNPVQVTCLLK
ncbi:MAG: endonuclease/exonuclease/phosphatase family protein [Bacteroidales bacterium]|nr:endonuclease/exonuclease/phosphatase family protein [Bacteroidales bacterium]